MSNGPENSEYLVPIPALGVNLRLDSGNVSSVATNPVVIPKKAPDVPSQTPDQKVNMPVTSQQD